MIQQNPNKPDMLYFQHNIYDLQNEYFGVFEREGFGENLLIYLKRLLWQDYKDVVFRVLSKLERCATTAESFSLREKSVALILDFANVLRVEKDRDLLAVAMGAVARWLSKEREFRTGFSRLMQRINDLVQGMFSLRLWSLSEPIVTASQTVISRQGDKDDRLRREVYLLHRQIVHPETIQNLVQDYYRGGRSDKTDRLLSALQPFSAEPMVQALVKAKNKDLRLSLLATLRGMRQGVLPVVLEKLWNRQAWYVIRNCISLLGALKDPDLFPFAKPYLYHPDVRVQKQVLHCVVELGGDDVVDRLVSSYDIIRADAKVELIEILSGYVDPQIGDLYLKILDNREKIPASIKNQIIQIICQSKQLNPSQKVIAVLADIRRECDRSAIEDKSLMSAVVAVQQSFLDVSKEL